MTELLLHKSFQNFSFSSFYPIEYETRRSPACLVTPLKLRTVSHSSSSSFRNLIIFEVYTVRTLSQHFVKHFAKSSQELMSIDTGICVGSQLNRIDIVGFQGKSSQEVVVEIKMQPCNF